MDATLSRLRPVTGVRRLSQHDANYARKPDRLTNWQKWKDAKMDILGWLTMVGEWAIAIVIGWEIWVALSEYRNSRMVEAIKYVEDDTTRLQEKSFMKN